MPPTRRTVLLAGLISLTGVALGGGALALRGTHRRTDVPPLTVLDADEYSILAAIADTFHPGAMGLPSATEVGVPQTLDTVFSTMHPADLAEIRQALALIENALVGALLQGRTTTFTGSSPQVRHDTLRAWQTSAIGVRRQAFKALKGLCAATYWSTPECGQLTGYPGPIDYGQALASKPTTFEPIAEETP